MSADGSYEFETSDDDLVRSLYQPLRRFAAVVGPAEIDPDDLVQDAFERTLARRSLRDLDDPGAYLRRTVFNLASNHRKRLGRGRGVLGRLVSTTPERPTYPSDLEELLRLPPTMRGALYLTAVEGRSFAEVGELLGCSEVAARKAASRGRHKLRHLLSGEETSATT